MVVLSAIHKPVPVPSRKYDDTATQAVVVKAKVIRLRLEELA